MFMLAAIVVAAFLGACGGVKPWERGTLAQPAMDPSSVSRVTATAFALHCYVVREGAIAGSGTASGGCGCN
jgi:hypothetical protein